MSVSRLLSLSLVGVISVNVFTRVSAQTASPKKTKPPASSARSEIDAGTVVNGSYRNKSLGLVCKIPEGWVLRTEEMNSREEGEGTEKTNSSPQGTSGNTDKSRVLLAAFSRPPEARGTDVNASIVIAAESVTVYPGLTQAAQYFGPLTEVAKGQGFTVDEEPYEFAIGTRNVVRGDFHKDVGTRVMRQSTLAFLSLGYAVSITVIGGTEDDVEELVDGVGFVASGK